MVTRIKYALQTAINICIGANPLVLLIAALVAMTVVSWCVFVCTF